MSIGNEEELMEALEKGGRLHYDRVNNRFKIYNPSNRKYRYVSSTLNDFARQLYEEQKRMKYGRGRGYDMEHFEEDMKFLLSTVRQRLDPKAPIITKWTENVSWWTHVFLDFSALVSPYILSLLTPSEIDLSNPEVTVKNMVGKFEALREKAVRVAEIEAKLKSENEALKRTLSEYEKLIDDQNKLIAEMLDKTKKTMNFFLIALPRQLPEELKGTYRAYVSRLKEVLGL
jgi:hypothetical protein